ncbi:MAG: MBL fold metallo-hydrolase, partial [Candidatus Thiodiazotropha endolucinida]
MCMTFFIRISLIALFYLGMLASAVQASSGIVKVTPLGSHDGEFCKFDCALLFEDPNGTRLLYDAGRTVAGGNDTRLGNVDVVLVSVEIALVHKAVFVTGSEMPKFFATRLQALGGDPKASLLV